MVPGEMRPVAACEGESVLSEIIKGLGSTATYQKEKKVIAQDQEGLSWNIEEDKVFSRDGA